ncbi:MAG TPA: Kiwa anti-phage protein KwaB-like domain-containing protein [Nevskiaceae bacterium]|nr:Kiwa anti-phage protein KwaB-like domain-containing protein [Nevskiaceae bacterium]
MDQQDAPIPKTDMPPTLVELNQQQQAAQKSADDNYQETDIFAWANNLFEYKEDLVVDLFLINKNNVLYRSKLDAQLQKQMQPLFVDEVLDAVLEGASTGMVVRGFEDGEAETNVLQRLRWKRVEKLVEVMHWIRTQEHEIELFVDEEHDLKRIKGAMARFSHPKMPIPFYMVKALSASQILKGQGAWIAQGKVFKPFENAAGFKIPGDNQLMILDQDLYVFNQAKLDRLFGYNAKKNSIAEKKAREIEARFSLSFAEGLDLQSAIKDSKATINKLQKIELGDLKQEQLIDHAEELGINLMTDESGAIIIMNQKDLNTFVSLLNDDYVESNLTGIRYEIQRKRPLRPAESDDM